MTPKKSVTTATLIGAVAALGWWGYQQRGDKPEAPLKTPPIAPVYSSPGFELGVAGRQGIILEKGNFFTVNYSPEWGGAFWVAYTLSPADMENDLPRSNPFHADPDLPDSLAVTSADYKGSGFDRGHLAPAADFERNKTAYRASFVMSNMHPQYGALNQQSWRLLEEAVRESVKVKARVWIVTGQLVGEFPKWIGKTHRVAVPSHSFKAVCMLDRSGNYSGFGALGENVKSGAAVSFVSIDSLEALSGFDFFCGLPDNLEAEVEEK